MNNILKWQAPGNGKIFDSKFGEDSYMNKRAICVLKYIQENSKVAKVKFEKEIKNYLSKCADYEKNDSIASHFFRPLLFFGFLYQDKNLNIDLTIEGRKFLNAYNCNDFDKCKEYMLNQLDNTKYPNVATSRVKLNLFPFRILFKLLLENKEKGLSSSFIKEQLIYIKSLDDIKQYLKSKNLDDIPKGNLYDKFYTWVINSLVDIEILKKDNHNYFIADDLIDKIEVLYNDIEYKDLFFNEQELACEINNKVAKIRYKRDIKLIKEAKKRDAYKCQVDGNHITFISKGKNYVEGHHLIPMFQQKNFDFNIDDLDNIISLCPNCHREIHLSDSKQSIIDNLFEKNREYMEINKVTKDDLYKMYECV